MDKNEFLFRFHLKQHFDSCHTYQHQAPLKSAAVLIALFDGSNSNNNNTDDPFSPDGLQVLLTKRASHLKHHPSQISFPGGKVELTDTDLVHTALREAQEEVGLDPKAVSVIGQLSNYEIISGYQITPIVAMINSIQTYQKDENEVDEIFHVPLKYFLQDENHHIVESYRNGRHHNVHFYPYRHYNIWGATASMIKDLVTRIK
ncbi:CoA pyrophosphatase [Colwellia sp. 20A7]|uniref:CoA pyrophosphatase n=1 Tax=Colwellia sp. 20A7 TaxID=2689569 RepID=UPI00135C9F61|nr:CoA pyrophosphatase [Colwellia sp. 20A7]